MHMVGALHRKLLREWKYISRNKKHLSFSSFHLKPQDSNYTLWHLVIHDESNGAEIYCMLLIDCNGENEFDPKLVMRCLTPNHSFPIKRNISLSHYSQTFVANGFQDLICTIWKLLFRNNNGDDFNQKYGSLDIKMMRCWNRIMCKSFKENFPELVGFLQNGDYKLVKDYIAYSRNGAETEQLRSGVESNSIINATTNGMIACDDNPTFKPFLFHSSTSNAYRKRGHFNIFSQDDELINGKEQNDDYQNLENDLDNRHCIKSYHTQKRHKI